MTVVPHSLAGLLLLAGMLAATEAWAPGRGARRISSMAAAPPMTPVDRLSLVAATTHHDALSDEDHLAVDFPATASPRTCTTTTTKTCTFMQRSREGNAVDSPPTITATPSRAQFLRQVVLGTLLVASGGSSCVEPASALYTEKGIQYPEAGEIASALPAVWSEDAALIDTADAFRRLDSRSDAIFYQEARFVEHVDAAAVTRLTDYCTKVTRGATAVLDMCASGTSHLPARAQDHPTQRVAGLGMNAEELAANHSLTEWVVRDLNAQPVLPYADQSMDVVLCQLSMDYLTQPVQVCREITRVLRPGGQVHILFSNRLFLSKAVAVWTGADDVDHAYLLGQYLHAAGALTDIAAADLSQRRRDGKIVGDPLYVVTAVRR